MDAVEPCWTKKTIKNPHLAGLKDVAGLLWILNWWRRRESNPRPQILRLWFYMRSRVFTFNRLHPDGQGKQTASPVCFSESASDKRHRDLVRVDPCSLLSQTLNAQARLQSEASRD